MKQKLGLLILIISFLTHTGVFAHPGHDHKKPISEEIAKDKARDKIKRLIRDKKIEPSWMKAEFLKAEKKKFGKKMEWVLTYSNKKIKDKTKKLLYIFLTLNGAYIASNHTGK